MKIIHMSFNYKTLGFTLKIYPILGWNATEYTLVIPAISDPKYEGPIGFKGVSEGTERGHSSSIVGSDNEMSVLKSFTNFSQRNQLGLKIFHDVVIERQKLCALSDAFGVEIPEIDPKFLSEFKNSELQLEIDIITITPSCICLTEVKSSFQKHGQTVIQLNRAEKVVRILLDIIGLQEKNIPIIKVCAVPKQEKIQPTKNTTSVDNLNLKARGNLVKGSVDNQIVSDDAPVPSIQLPLVLIKSNIELMIFNLQSEVEKLLNKIHPKICKENQQILHNSMNHLETCYLIAALTFMKCSNYFPNANENVYMSETTLLKTLQLGAKGKEISDKLQAQSPLEKWKNPEVMKVEAQEPFLLWINPLTSDHFSQDLDCSIPFPKILISSEKRTMTFRFKKTLEKIKQIVLEDPGKKVLVLLPDDDMVQKYQNAFRICDLTDVVITKELENLKNYIGSEVFIHKAAMPKCVSYKNPNHSEALKNFFTPEHKDTIIWLDPTQSKALKENHPRHIIRGPASTGKTILLQLKVLHLIKSSKDDKILILLPFQALVDKYKAFFEKSGVSVDDESFVIAIPQERKLEKFIENKKPHVFIDEFTAVWSGKSLFTNKLQSYLEGEIPDSKLLWITIDHKQSLDVFEGDYLSSDFMKCAMKNALETDLLIVHRCTKMVFERYKHFCGHMVALGHQWQGNQTTTCNTPNNLMELANEVTSSINRKLDEGWRKKDICIIFPFTMESLLLIQLYILLQMMNLGVKMVTQEESLSQEWPIVIVCGNFFI